MINSNAGRSKSLGYCHTNVECTNAGGYWWSINSCLPDEEIITEIVEVTSAGQVWMDRNLGASRVATSSTDSLAYGYLFQWGRGADGHQSRGSSTITKLSPTDVPGHGKFILIDYISPYDWRVEQNNALWQGANGINNPCPAGFRIPTRQEMKIELDSWKTQDSTGAFASPLKFTLAEVRPGEISNNGEVTSGYGGIYSTSTTEGTGFYALCNYDSSSYICGTSTRASGGSIRCIKD